MMVRDWFELLHGGGELDADEARARVLLQHIIDRKLARVNEREIRETPGLDGLSSAAKVKAAVEILALLHVLRRAPHEARAGRPRREWLVWSEVHAVCAA